MLFGVAVSCRILYYFELICLLSFPCNSMVSVRRGFLFFLVPGMGCVISLWQSLGLPYNSFDCLPSLFFDLLKVHHADRSNN